MNSASHVWGYQDYNTGDQSRNNWWVGILAFGEGWHNNVSGGARGVGAGGARCLRARARLLVLRARPAAAGYAAGAAPRPDAPRPHPQHHAFEYSARHGFDHWWQVDMTWYCIWALQKLGLATNVKLPTDKQKARLRFGAAAASA